MILPKVYFYWSTLNTDLLLRDFTDFDEDDLLSGVVPVAVLPITSNEEDDDAPGDEPSFDALLFRSVRVASCADCLISDTR